MTARLHVLLGAGGVGKTTLAAGYALALAQQGRRVGLLGIDPARRLQTALSLDLPDLEVPVPGAPTLEAALLKPAESLRRWAEEACPDPGVRARLVANPFFLALADRLAGASDILAAVRLAEWAEHDPELTDLVVDTAPGFNAVEFLRRPQRLSAFLEGTLVTWLRWFAKGPTGTFGALLRGGAQRVLGSLAHVIGGTVLLQLAEFVSLVDGVFARMAQRLAQMQKWLRDPSTEILLVTAVRSDAVVTTREIATAIGSVGLSGSVVVVNRALPPSLGPELEALRDVVLPPEGLAVTRYARAFAQTQAQVVAEVAQLAPRVVIVPGSTGLDTEGRLEALRALGQYLLPGTGTPSAL